MGPTIHVITASLKRGGPAEASGFPTWTRACIYPETNFTASAEAGTKSFRPRTHEWDTETGLYYYPARYYDQLVGASFRGSNRVSSGTKFLQICEQQSDHACRSRMVKQLVLVAALSKNS